VSLGYRKGKSIRDVALGIRNSYENGFGYVLDADLQKFFDTLDHDRLELLIDEWVGLSSTAGKLLRRFIHTKPIPHKIYKDKSLSYFQNNKYFNDVRQEGVPQGGVLSGMLANLYLHEFDRWVVFELGKKFDLRYFRYADDFVIMTRTLEDAKAIYEPVKEKLESLKLVIHPLEDHGKTKVVDIAKDHLEFVGFQFTHEHIRVKSSNVQRFKDRFKESKKEKWDIVSSASVYEHLFLVVRRINPKIEGPTPEICDVCGGIKDKYRNWISVFAPVVTDVNQIKKLDHWIRNEIYKYFWKKYGIRLKRNDLTEAGLKNIVNQYYRVKAGVKFCECADDIILLDAI
jgi:hypothetical protein